ncbi:MAG: hypothetical protein ABSB49_04515 [Polyangia bacterium]
MAKTTTKTTVFVFVRWVTGGWCSGGGSREFSAAAPGASARA